MNRGASLAREAVISALAAASFAAVLAWFGPPGGDLAAHAYQRTLFLEHGLVLWNNFWYAGRYSFVTYSLLYYPLAAVLGIRLLAVATVTAAALAFAVVLGREWGPAARWSSRTFAVVWAGIVLSATFPFALGAALALLALWALQLRSHRRFALLALLTLAASPLAFLLLALLLAGVAIAKRAAWARSAAPALTVVMLGGLAVLTWRLFPAGGHYPFSTPEFVAACLFFTLGVALTWRVERAHLLRWIFLVFLAACVATYLVPSALGENITRLRLAAIPVVVLALSLRRWRPRIVALGALALAIAWNTSPFAVNFRQGEQDPSARASYWQPVISYLHAHLGPSYRVEAVDTVDHWEAVFLPRARIPIARGWYRQDDFPTNRVLYGKLTSRAYRHWLHRLGVRWVVLTTAPPDYSARAEAALLRSGESGLRPVLETTTATIYSVPSPQPIVTGTAPARVLSLTEERIVLEFQTAGDYRLAIRYSPYWHTSHGCLSRESDGMLRLSTKHAGVVSLTFDVDPGRALATLAGEPPRICHD